MQQMFFPLVQQRATRPMGDAFRLPGRAAGIHDIQRDVEVEAGEVDFFCREISDEIRQRLRIQDHFAIRCVVQQGQYHDLFNTGQVGQEFPNPGQAFMAFAIVEITIGGKQNLWLRLSKPVQHALQSKIRGATGPDRPQ